jgi:aminoglycoside phosphotransferase (APT) family kinase protein
VSSPPADVPEPDEAAVRRLLAASSDPTLADLPIEFVARGWDNSVWRVGDRLVARVPVREQAVELIENEARWGREVVSPLAALGAVVAQPVALVPPGAHPYPWLLSTWVDGDLLEDVPVADRGPVSIGLAAVLPLLHRPAPPEAPLNPFRGVDLADMAPIRADALERSRQLLGPVAEDLLAVFEAGKAAPRWPGPRVWCHGDLHPRNLLLRPGSAADSSSGCAVGPESDAGVGGPASRLGVLDLGDLTAGEPAVDLSVLWLAFSPDHREVALEVLAPAYDPDVLARARGWAARFVLAVAGVFPDPFRRTLAHATAQLVS